MKTQQKCLKPAPYERCTTPGERGNKLKGMVEKKVHIARNSSWWRINTSEGTICGTRRQQRGC